jgi:hypothetical protein
LGVFINRIGFSERWLLIALGLFAFQVSSVFAAPAQGVLGHTYFLFAEVKYRSSTTSYDQIDDELQQGLASLYPVLYRSDAPLLYEWDTLIEEYPNDNQLSRFAYYLLIEPSRSENLVELQYALDQLKGLQLQGERFEVREAKSLRVLNLARLENWSVPFSEVELRFGQRTYPNLAARKKHDAEIGRAISGPNPQAFFEFFARLLGLDLASPRSRALFQSASRFTVATDLEGIEDDLGVFHPDPCGYRGSGLFRDCAVLGGIAGGGCL